MIFRNTRIQTVAVVACITSSLAQSLPYNPTFLLQGQNNKIFQFQPTNPQFGIYDVTNTLNAGDAPHELTNQLPFLSNASNSFVPVTTRDGISVFTGECSDGEQELNLWTYGFGLNNQTWTQMKTTSSNTGLSANFLAAGFAFPSDTSDDVDSMYVFGGMCPDGASNSSTWTTSATYSNTMLTISPEKGDDYEVSLTGTRSPPVAEAGLSITPLLPVSLRPDNTSQQQNFVLIGGHTQQAFVDTSQVAIFSMPQQSWAFVNVQQPTRNQVEPRSGHSAVLTADGSRIIVFGGWVGSVSNPATPSLAILEIGQGYGGNGSWSWVSPSAQTNMPGGAQGLYGHGAVMLPGDIMMVTGGIPINSAVSKIRRATSNTMFYNISSATWSESYINPLPFAAAKKESAGLSSTGKTGLGAGLGVGLTLLVIGFVVCFLFYRRRKAEKRLREQRLRAMALGTHDGPSMQEISGRRSQTFISGLRSASWSAREEHSIGIRPDSGYQNDLTPATVAYAQNTHRDFAENDITDVGGPSIGMKNSLRSRGPPGFGTHIPYPAPGVFTIEEVEERSEANSLKRPQSAQSRPLSDPFKDPSTIQPQGKERLDEAAERRKKEVQTWVDDWQSAAESMNVSRSPSKATSHGRTYSNLSAFQSSSSSSEGRTGSNLSERSTTSGLSRTPAIVTLSRNPSQRGGSASYALFSAAAAAMGRLAGRQDHAGPQIERSASKRAVSTGDLAQMAANKRTSSVEQNNPFPLIVTPQSREDLDAAGSYFTPPESPIKDYKGHARKRSNSLTGQSKKALGALSSGAKRILTGTGSVSVLDKVNTIETKGKDVSPTRSTGPETLQSPPRQVSSSGTSFWKHKQGAKDWDDPTSLGANSGTVRRRSGRPERLDGENTPGATADDASEDWDVEAAVQQRVVQVMFTVPKEKLRVVNADNLSLLSRSDTQTSRNSNKSDDAKGTLQNKEVNRMSRLTEAGEEPVDDEQTIVASDLQANSALSTAKGKERESRPILRAQRSGGNIGKAS